MYKVIKSFSDAQDSGFVYRAGDIFPRLGKEVSKERIAELASKNNRRKEVLIEYVAEKSENKNKASATKRRRRKNAGTDSQDD